MTIEEAYGEMRRRGWGFARTSQGFISIGPILNPDYVMKGEHPIIEVLAMGLDPVQTLKAAITTQEKNGG